ncbi:MAG: ABC transporter permease [Eubacterium sp.]|nr:ABC transporter permease [Eubacterium sp.]MCI8918472.1 ABC transporter permease [Eubacterium sp.]
MPGACAQGLVWGIMALGVYITYKLLDFADLTVDSTLATGGAVAVMMILAGVPTPAALIGAAAAGGAAGFITGFLHTVLGIPDILSGILTQIAFYSVNLNILGASNKSVSVDMYHLVISLRYVTQAIVVTIIFILVLTAALYWFFGTEYGFTIRSTGCNPHMSRAQGVNTNKSKVAALVISNAIVGLSGGLLAQYQGYADVGMGRGAIVIGLASVIIGQVLRQSILGQKANFAVKMLFVVVGAVIYYLVITFVLWLGLPSENMKMFSAIVVAVFLAVPYLRAKAKSSFRKGGSR